MQVYNINIRKSHFQANLCELFAEDEKQHYCGDVGWADLLFMKSSRIIISYVYRQAILLIALIAKFMTFTCKSRCRFMCSRCTFVKVWNADQVAEIYMQTVSM